MLTIEEINKELCAQVDLKIECFDFTGFINNQHYKAVMCDLSENPTVTVKRVRLEEGIVEIIDARYICIEILSDQLQFFRIKRPAPLLSDLKTGGKVFIREDLEDEKEYERGHYFFKDNMKTGEQILNDVCDGFVEIKDDHLNRYTYSMIDWEKTIKLNANKAPNFDDLIDVAYRAYRDGIFDEISIDKSSFTLVGATGIHHYYERSRGVIHCHKGKDSLECTPRAIKYIKSLYTETFVIECEEDEMKIRQPVKSIILANGEEIINENRLSLLQEGLCLKAGVAGNIKIPFSLLKGATVTQKRVTTNEKRILK